MLLTHGGFKKVYKKSSKKSCKNGRKMENTMRSKKKKFIGTMANGFQRTSIKKLKR